MIMDRLVKDHYRRREWRGIGAAAELQTPAHETHLGGLHDVLVPPAGIRTRRQQHDHHRVAVAALLAGFLHPLADLAAIGGIAPARARPILSQAVYLRGEIGGTLGGFGGGAHVEMEVELLVQAVEEVLRGLPGAVGAGKHHLGIHP